MAGVNAVQQHKEGEQDASSARKEVWDTKDEGTEGQGFEGYAESKFKSPLPDHRNDDKAWGELQEVLNPPPIEGQILSAEYCCSLTKLVIREAVNLADGKTYEREAAEAWIAHHDTSPTTGQKLGHKNISPNAFAQATIDREIEAKRLLLKDSTSWYLPKTWIKEIRQACLAGDLNAIQSLAKRDRRLLVHRVMEGEYQGQRLLHLAVRNLKSLEVIVELLEMRRRGLGLACLLQGDDAGIIPLESALRSGLPADTILALMGWMGEEILSRLRFTGALPPVAREPLNQALLKSIQNGDVAKARILLGWGANANAQTDNGEPYLGVVLRTDNTSMVRALLDAKASLEAPHPPLGEAALQKAVRLVTGSGPLEIVQLLCARGANLRTPRRDGQTALHVAAQQPRVDILQLLCEQNDAKALLKNSKDAEGRTALFHAAEGGHEAVVEFLIKQQGVDTVAADAKGDTPLHAAARQAHAGTLELLLTAKVDEDIENKAEKTAREVAAEQSPEALEAYDSVCGKLRERKAAIVNEEGVLGPLFMQQQDMLRQQRQMIRILQKQVRALETGLMLGATTSTSLSKSEDKGRVRDEASELKAPKPTAAKEAVLDEKEIIKFMSHIANNEQSQAEVMIQAKPQLLLVKAKITDPSGRVFDGYTAWQYTRWARGWHMGQMLLKNMDRRTAAEQTRDMKARETRYGQQANCQGLVDGLREYNRLMNDGEVDAAAKVWVGKIGTEQLQAPTHIAHEYHRPLALLLNFKNPPPEVRVHKGVDWYDARCGKEWANRWESNMTEMRLTRETCDQADKDLEAVELLWTTCVQQWEQLDRELEKELEQNFASASSAVFLPGSPVLAAALPKFENSQSMAMSSGSSSDFGVGRGDYKSKQ